jgi:formylmethanofuran dehydrogenase subunit C
MALRIVSRHDSSLPVEMPAFTPTWAAGKSLGEIERFEIRLGRRPLPLAERFDVSGDAGDMCWRLGGNWSAVHGMAAGMAEGAIHLEGDGGRHWGGGMRGGELTVDGDLGDWAGAEMAGGVLRIRGNAGDSLGGALVGSARGMTGGTILVEGNAGSETGAAMRRGLIAVGGDAGRFLGRDMLAGTILVFGECGDFPGVEMQRGTIGVFGNKSNFHSPTFVPGNVVSLPMMPLLLRQLRDLGFPLPEGLESAVYRTYHGDVLASSRGELLHLVDTAGSKRG